MRNLEVVNGVERAVPMLKEVSTSLIVAPVAKFAELYFECQDKNGSSLSMRRNGNDNDTLREVRPTTARGLALEA